MPITIKQDAFDSVTAPTLPDGGWIASGGNNLVTTTTRKRSSPNSLSNNGATSDTFYWNTKDGNGGDQQVTAYFNFDTDYSASLYGRQVVPPADTCYHVDFYNANSSVGEIRLYYNVGGTGTQIGSGIPVTNIVLNRWYKCQLMCSGSSIRFQMIDDTNGNYLQTNGTFSSSAAFAFDVTDSHVTGSGNAGVRVSASAGSGGMVWVDDFLFESLASSSSSSSSKSSSSPTIGAARIFQSAIISGLTVG
jgi:hypothetical protein